MSNDINFKATKKQSKAIKYLFDDHTTELGYGGGAGGGKSYLGAFYVFAIAWTYEDTRPFLGRKELKNLKKTTLQTLFKIFNEYNLKSGVDYKFNQQDGYIEFAKTGSRILLLDLAYKPSDPLWTDLGSLELTCGYVDESNEVNFGAIDTLSVRVGRWNNDKHGIKPMIMEGFNPSKNHVYRRYYRPFKDNKMPGNRAFVKALAVDNPHNSKEYIEQLRNIKDKARRERLLYGNFEYDDDPNALFDIDSLNDLFSNVVDAGDKYLTVDAARLGSDWAVLMAWNGLKVLEIKVIEKSRLDFLEQEIEKMRQKHQVKMSQTLVDEGGLGGGVVDHLKCKGFVSNARPIERKKKEQQETGYKVNYQNLRSQCYYTLAEKVEKGEIAVSTKNVQYRDMIIEELEHIKAKDVDKDNKLKIISKDQIKEDLGRSPDFADTLMMRMYYEVQPVKKKARIFTNKAF